MQNIYLAFVIIALIAFTYATPIRDDDMDLLRRERRQGKDMNMSTTAMQTMTRQLGLPVGAQPVNSGLLGYGSYPGSYPGAYPSMQPIGTYPGGLYPTGGIYGNGFYASGAGTVDPNQLNALVNLANQPGLFSQNFQQPFLQPGLTGIPTNPYYGAQYPQQMLG